MKRRWNWLYAWEVAMNACPDGWHLPSMDEWDVLFRNVGDGTTAGAALKTRTGWEIEAAELAGKDAYGFGVLPAGYREKNNSFVNAGEKAYFWSSTLKTGEKQVYAPGFVNDGAYIDGNYFSKNVAFSVRCVK